MKLKYQLCDTAHCTNENLAILSTLHRDNLYLCKNMHGVFTSKLYHVNDYFFVYDSNLVKNFSFDELDECWLVDEGEY